MLKHLLPILALGAVISSCSTTRVVKPLKRGDWEVGANYGGPYVNSGMLPMTGLYFAHGSRDHISIFGGVQTTTMAFNTLQLDFGVCHLITNQNGLKPGISLNAVINPMIGFRDASFRLYPELTPNFYWDLDPEGKHLVYGGFTNWFDPTYGKAVYEKGKLWHPALNVGYKLNLPKFTASIEGKWLNYNKQLSIPQATVNSINGNGGLGIYAG
ncbi:MAG: hypothetical protein KDC92_16265, partial [Bacteroidetes bacterium]|nr:hypothetical protein [Bacteroidota bacterium]